MPDTEKNKWLRISSVISEMRRSGGPSLRLEELAAVSARELSVAFDPAGCAIYLVDHTGTNNLTEIGLKQPASKTFYAADMPLVKHFAGSVASIFILSRDEGLPFEGLFPGDASGSVICAPLLAEAAVSGFIFLESEREGAFTPDDLSLVEFMADEISLLMANAALRAKVEFLTIRDPLTGCFNQKKFDDDIEIDITCTDRYGKPLSLLKIDIDFMHEYNKTFGRTEGDKVIKKVGETLAYSTRMCDKLYRFSGEEFIIILPGVEKERAVFAAFRMQKVLGQLRFEVEVEGRPAGKITFSIGVASFPSDAVYKDGLLRKVDAALRQAIEAGGNTVVSL
jgi:diguanylate cyclase (GGDEF)-like protein